MTSSYPNLEHFSSLIVSPPIHSFSHQELEYSSVRPRNISFIEQSMNMPRYLGVSHHHHANTFHYINLPPGPHSQEMPQLKSNTQQSLQVVETRLQDVLTHLTRIENLKRKRNSLLDLQKTDISNKK